MHQPPFSLQHFLHPTDSPVYQHHFDAMGMRGALSEDSCDDTLGHLTVALVLLLDYPHPRSRADPTSIRDCHDDSFPHSLIGYFPNSLTVS